MPDLTLTDSSGDEARVVIGSGFAPGAVVRDRYEIEERLGSGGMGVVYAAVDRETGKRIALKTLKGVDPQSLFRFKREFRSLADMRHANLVRLHDLVIEDEHPFFTMDLVEGVDLHTYLRAGATPGKVPNLARVRFALRQLVDAICALHRAGKLHRDVKPSNVLVSEEGRVSLLDFGLVSELTPRGHEVTSAGRVIGTPTYMSPEQAAGDSLTEASDFYAVGVILYHALTGRLPFDGGARRVLASKQVTHARPPSYWVPDLPEDLDRLTGSLLARDPGARIGGRELLLALGRDEAEVSDATSPSDSFASIVGRAAELDELHRAYEDVGQGATLSVRVSGRSGTGKSTLIGHFLDSLRRGGQAVVLTGRCLDREAMPYKGVDGLVDSLSQYLANLPETEAALVTPRNVRALARLFPVLERADVIRSAPSRQVDRQDPQAVRRMAMTALRELLGAIGDHHPLVLAIDDLQWSDLDSVALLTELVRGPDAPQLLLVVGHRSETPSPAVEAFRAIDGCELREVSVEPLDAASAATLALGLLGREDEEARNNAARIAEEAGGNPFHVGELVRALMEETSPADELRDGLGPGPGRTLDDLVMARLSRLRKSARGLLEVVAVAGGPVPRAVAGEAAAIGPETLPFDELIDARLLRQSESSEDAIETIHDRIREIVVAHLGGTRLRAVHRSLAVSLEKVGADAELLCEHFRHAGARDRAGEYAELAADNASQALAFDRAARLYRTALELREDSVSTDDPDFNSTRQVLSLRLADALSNAGHGPDAAELYVSLVPMAGEGRGRDLQRRAAEELLRSGHTDRGLAALRGVLESVDVELPATRNRAIIGLLIGRLLLKLRGTKFTERSEDEVAAETLERIDVCWSVVHGLAAVSSIQGAEFQNRHLRMALAAGEPYRVGRALAFEALFLSSQRGGVKWARRLLRQAEDIGTRLDNPHVLGLASLMSGYVSLLRCQWRDAKRRAKASQELLEGCAGVVYEKNLARQLELSSALYLGDFDDLSRLLPPQREDAERRGDLLALVELSTLLSQDRLIADDLEGARACLEQTIDRWSQSGFNTPDYMRIAGKAQIDLYCGRGRTAYERWELAWPDLRKSLLLQVDMFRLLALDLRARSALMAAREAADLRPFVEVVRRDISTIRRTNLVAAEPMANMLAAGIAMLRKEPVAADDLYQAAAAGFDAADMAAHAAMARCRRGKLIGGDAGKTLHAEGEALLVARGVENPERMIDAHAP